MLIIPISGNCTGQVLEGLARKARLRLGCARREGVTKAPLRRSRMQESVTVVEPSKQTSPVAPWNCGT